MNRNVGLNLALAGVGGTADSIWSGTMLVAFLSTLTNGSNTKVGLITALQGATTLVTALPAGWAADRFSRAKIIAVGGVVMLLSVGACSYTVIASADDSDDLAFVLMCIGLSLFGFSQGVISGPAQALLADSLPTGFRDKYYNLVFVCYLAGSAIGPLMAVILFSIWQGYTSQSEEWPMDDLRIVLLIGLALEIPCAGLMFMFRDDKALGQKSDAVADQSAASETEEDRRPLHESLIADTVKEEGEGGADSEPEKTPTAEEAQWSEWMKEASQMKGLGFLTVHHVPYIAFGSDLVISLASGMTIKFFPLFFKDDCNMSAAEVQTIYFIVPIAMALAGTLGTSLGGCSGRAQMVVLLRVLGLSFFGAIVALYHFGYNKWLVVAAYIFRTALMNSTYPLEESILMDYVPKHQRARWKSLESVSSFGWCGSAALGGYLSDAYGYTATFLITIGMQALATLIYSVMITLVINKRPQDMPKNAAEVPAVIAQ